MKPFNLEAFKKSQKALTRDGRVASFAGICEQCEIYSQLLALLEGDDQVMFFSLDGKFEQSIGEYNTSRYDLVAMASRHQALIDSYNPEDTWQYLVAVEWVTCKAKPAFDEYHEYRLHPHNDLIKEWKKGAKIEAYIVDNWVEEPNPDWYEDTQYRIKPEQKTKTVYEWLYKIEADRYQLHPYLMDEEEAKVNFGKYAHKKTGRSWEVEI